MDAPDVFTNKLASHIQRLKGKSAPGDDGLGNIMMKHFSSNTVSYLAKVFYLLLSVGLCPNYWRLSLLFPIHKGKPVLSALDLRPIALTSTLGKLFERVLNEELLDFVSSNGILPPEQCGFLRGKSTLGPTSRIAQRLRELPTNSAMAGLFLDVKKAFNSVWHNGLLYKLQSCGLPSHYTRWISDWLRARSYKSRVREHKSKAAFHECGVPQGTVLSPLLFILFFSDVVDEISSDSFLFADDLSMLSRAFKVGNRMAFSSLQRDVWAIERWCVQWKMQFEPLKTKLVIFSRCRHVDRSSFRIRLGSMHIAPSPVARCLGVWFDEKYTFAHEARIKLERFNSKIKLILRLGGLKWGCRPRCLIKLFMTVALPTLTYNPWSLFLAPKRHLLLAIRAQRSALKRFLSLPSCSGGDVAEVYCGVPPLDLHLRRLCAGVIVNLVSGKDTLFVNECEAYCDSDRVTKDLHRKVATWQSPFGVFVRSLTMLDLPLFPMGCTAPSRVSPSVRSMPFPEMPSLRKSFSPANKERARLFGLRCIDTVDPSHNILFVDGGLGLDGLFYAALFVVCPDGSTFSFVARLSGTGLSSHTAEIFAIRLAIAWSTCNNASSVIVSDSQSAIKASLSPTSVCPHARANFEHLQTTPSMEKILWVPSHVGVWGNYTVDKLVTAGDSDACVSVPISVSCFKTLAKKSLRAIWDQRWIASPHSPELHCLTPSLLTNRNHIFGTHTARTMARLRTGHCGTPSFLHRHGLAPSNLCLSCSVHGASEHVGSVSHFFVCRANRPHNRKLRRFFSEVLGHRITSLKSVLSMSLSVGLQIRFANALVDFLHSVTEFGFL